MLSCCNLSFLVRIYKRHRTGSVTHTSRHVWRRQRWNVCLARRRCSILESIGASFCATPSFIGGWRERARVTFVKFGSRLALGALSGTSLAGRRLPLCPSTSEFPRLASPRWLYRLVHWIVAKQAGCLTRQAYSNDQQNSRSCNPCAPHRVSIPNPCIAYSSPLTSIQ